MTEDIFLEKQSVKDAIDSVSEDIERLKTKIREEEEQSQEIDAIEKILFHSEKLLQKVVFEDEKEDISVIGKGMNYRRNSVENVSSMIKNQLLKPMKIKEIRDVKSRTKSLTEMSSTNPNKFRENEFEKSFQESKINSSPFLLKSKNKGPEKSEISNSSKKQTKAPKRNFKKKVFKKSKIVNKKKNKKLKKTKKKKKEPEVQTKTSEWLKDGYAYEPMSLIGEFNRQFRKEFEKPTSKKETEGTSLGSVDIPRGKSAIVSIQISQCKDIWKKDYRTTQRCISKLRKFILKLIKKTSGSILSNHFFDSFLCIFPSIIHACEFCVGLQIQSNYVPYPLTIEKFVPTVRDEEDGIIIFRGLRLLCSVVSGQAGKDFEYIESKNLILGDILKSISLLMSRCLEGEIVFPKRYLEHICKHQKHFSHKTRIICREEDTCTFSSERSYVLVPENLFNRELLTKRNFWFLDKDVKLIPKKDTDENGKKQENQIDQNKENIEEKEKEESTKRLEMEMNELEMDDVLMKIWKSSTKLSKIKALLKLERKANINLFRVEEKKDGGNFRFTERNREQVGVSYSVEAGLIFLKERQRLIDSIGGENLLEEIKKDTMEYIDIIQNQARNFPLKNPYLKKKKKIIKKKKTKKIIFSSRTKSQKKKKKKKKKKRVKGFLTESQRRRITELDDQILIHGASAEMVSEKSVNTELSFFEAMDFSFWKKQPLMISVGIGEGGKFDHDKTQQTFEDPRLVKQIEKVQKFRRERDKYFERKEFWKKKSRENIHLLKVQARLLGYDDSLRKKYLEKLVETSVD